MSHISRVGRGSLKVRAGIGALYGVLIAGAITTLYPFLLMVSTATKSQVDYNDYTLSALVPRYLRDDRALYAKYIEDRYANNLDDINAAHHADYARTADVKPPVEVAQPGTDALVADWNTFTQTLPETAIKAGFGEHDSAPSRLLLLYRDHARQVFHGDIAALNKAWTEENVSFDAITPPFERVALRTWTPDYTRPKVRDWYLFKKTLPSEFRVVVGDDAPYRTYLRQDVYEDDLKHLNRVWQTAYADWSQITLPRTVAETAVGERPDWEKFVRTKFPLRMLLPNADAPTALLTTNSPENQWRMGLQKQFGTVEKADAAFGTRWKAWRDAQPPQAEADDQFALEHATDLRGEFAGRNFRAVSGYIFLHGDALFNTFAFCLLAIASALIVNPMCAYALSRYPLPYAYKVLLFLLATMAFPAEVALIPNFLLLRDLHLLNTFGALVLPGLASGFSIFLLKGFFDSLPKELYEAGILDGASELTMFRRITVPLSLPIFSVLALNAFTGSYGAFLFALVTCQDPKMWTLMVWLYNLQDSAPQYVIMAALTLAALPTLVVFLFAQKIIMRGIILPSFK